MTGKVVLITGPARGIGAEMARLLAARGARLSLVGMEPALLQALAEELGSAHVWFACDVTQQSMLEQAVRGTVAALGRIDIVVANAGIASEGTVQVVETDALVRVLEVNLLGVVRTVKTTLAHVIDARGYYLLISSAAAFSALPGLATYAASKAGVEQFANVLRLELRPCGVQVGSAHMSWIDTDLVRDVRRDLHSFEQTLRRLPGPFGTVTSLADCAAALVHAVERRARTVFVPSSLRLMSILRMVLNSAMVQRLLRGKIEPMVVASEQETRDLGRPFGKNSVGMGARGSDERQRS